MTLLEHNYDGTLNLEALGDQEFYADTSILEYVKCYGGGGYTENHFFRGE